MRRAARGLVSTMGLAGLRPIALAGCTLLAGCTVTFADERLDAGLGARDSGRRDASRDAGAGDSGEGEVDGGVAFDDAYVEPIDAAVDRPDVQFDDAYEFPDVWTEPPPVDANIDAWSDPRSCSYGVGGYRGQNGLRLDHDCPPGCTGAVWGTDVYTDDSNVCTAAIHAGIISSASGGAIGIIIAPGESSYTGSTRNGVTSASYGTWPGSYRVVR